MNISLGKAGRKRWMGRKPHNRGTSMNPVNHPMGGGEGRTAGGRHPCSPTGVLAKGGKTRKKRKPSNSAIIRRRRPGPHYARTKWLITDRTRDMDLSAWSSISLLIYARFTGVRSDEPVV